MASPNLAAPMERTTRMSEKIRVGVSIWPIRAAYLRALTELGLSDLKIAEYLRVGPEQVASLRKLYRITEGRWREKRPLNPTLAI